MPYHKGSTSPVSPIPLSASLTFFFHVLSFPCVYCIYLRLRKSPSDEGCDTIHRLKWDLLPINYVIGSHSTSGRKKEGRKERTGISHEEINQWIISYFRHLIYPLVYCEHIYYL